MDASTVSALVVELFAAIRLLSGYPAPDTMPEVHRVSQAEMRQIICGGRACPVKAFYHPDRGVFIDETMDVRNDAFDRSVLLHELVHHLQKTTGKFDAVPGKCSRRNAQELEAYEIQNRYLAQEQASRRALVMGMGTSCRDES